VISLKLPCCCPISSLERIASHSTSTPLPAVTLSLVREKVSPPVHHFRYLGAIVDTHAGYVSLADSLQGCQLKPSFVLAGDEDIS
jgi:hypothetical protein